MAPSLSLFLLLCPSLLASIPLPSAALGFDGETHLHLYWHEINTGPNSTTALAVPLNSSTSGFGGVVVIDDELRQGPEPDSKLIGRAQGLVPAVSQEELTFHIDVNFVFSDGKHNGSTLAVYGRVVIASDTKEWSIIGGTGQFRLARGYVLGKKLTPPAGEDFLTELNIHVLRTKI